MTKGLNRRTLAKGVAWAAPAVLATAAVPAYAASSDTCNTVYDMKDRIRVIDTAQGRRGNRSIWMDFGAAHVSIPADRTVTSVSLEFWISKHSGTNDGSSVGLPSPSNPNMKYYAANASGTARGSLTYTGTNPTSGTFWHFSEPNIPAGPAYPFEFLGESDQVWEDGSSGPAWGMRTTWMPGDIRQPVVVQGAEGCAEFEIPQMGSMQWSAQGVYVPLNPYIPRWRTLTIVLDDGTVLTKRVSGGIWENIS